MADQESPSADIMRYCPQCGEQPPADAAYCHRCGSRLENADGAAALASLSGASGAVYDRLTEGHAAGESLPTEVETWQGSFSSLAMMGTWLTAGVVSCVALVAAGLLLRNRGGWVALLVALAVVWIGLALRLFYRQLSVHYFLTNQRFIHERGLLWRVIDRVELIDVDDITFHQGPVERIFGVGTIRIRSSDQSHPEIDLPGIDHVRQVSNTMDELRRAERQRRGLHIEAI